MSAETPMFRQYHALKAEHPDAVLFFRMGDFYECFFRDAEIVSEILELTLTARNKRDENPIPMAGVPHHAAAGYIQRLVERGIRVAIAEQVEDPAQAKGLVRREVVRVVTPGVVLDPTSLEARQANYIVGACSDGPEAYGLAFVDLSTGDFRVTQVGSIEAVIGEVMRLEPREALLAPELEQQTPLLRALRRLGTVVSPVHSDAWTPHNALSEVRDCVGTLPEAGQPGVRAGGAVLRYARDTTRAGVKNVHEIRPYEVGGFMVVDETSRRNLEIVKTLREGRRKGSLLHLLDHTGTPMGSRLLREWLAFPLLDLARIRRRQQAVAALVEDSGVRNAIREALKRVADVERIGARVVQGTANARDLVALGRSLESVPEVVRAGQGIPALSRLLPEDLCEDLSQLLAATLVEDPPAALTEGGLIRRGVNEELDTLVSLSLSGIGVIGEVEERERAATGITSLKIRRNKVFGYFIEVTRANLHRVPDTYIRKQTLTNAERYITPELKELEERVLGADERRKSLEYELFVALREQVAEHSRRLLMLARRLAGMDVLATLAQLALSNHWSCPTVDESVEIAIEAGRHPVIEAMLDEERFVPNDVVLGGDRQLIVLTGPNMAGKSTVMRQVALIVLLAQIGSFVPAERARIGRCDRIFTRVGAADDLASGQSTFMVEMAETAAILHHASARSLVILDEIGRGTSTYDGLSIAWAVAEDLVTRVGCRTLFATHFHELCDLQDAHPRRVVNQSVAVSEYGDEIVFLRRLKEGGASRSYGIQCARLAGLPDAVIGRARDLLRDFEKRAPRNDRQQLSLFGRVGQVAPEAVSEPAADALREMLAGIDPDDLSPREAQSALYRLKMLS